MFKFKGRYISMTAYGSSYNQNVSCCCVQQMCSFARISRVQDAAALVGSIFVCLISVFVRLWV